MEVIHFIPFYLQGTVSQLQDMTGWKGERVLYFGDHPYTDLADASLMHGWRTGAIIKELTVVVDFRNEFAFERK